ncbi:MAG TPA: extracellular solute-binding protein [Candidatus Limnocylindrales bacterium]|nr:extracellular solute-binding protein [Candidatus Limnocylindrales bacterium]
MSFITVVKTLFLLLVLSAPLVGVVDGAEPKASAQAAWEDSLRATRKEGAVSVYFWQGGNLDKVLQVFQQKYPDIRLAAVGGRGSGFITRIVTEMRANKHLVDVCICGVTSPYDVLHKRAEALESIKSALILPDVTDSSKWWQGKHHYQDPEGRYIFVYWGRAAATRVSFNSKAVNPAEFSSYWDILNPKWKGKIVAIEPTESAGGWRSLYYKPGVGAEFLQRLFGEMSVMFSREDRQAGDWLAVGKASLGLFLSAIPEAKGQGLPVDEFKDSSFKEPPSLDSGPNGTIALMKQAPHPNGAKIFINWFLSREGQTIYQELMNSPTDQVESMREDIPKEPVPAAFRRRTGVEYVPMFMPDRMDPAPIIKLFKETVKR